ncbi:hypothetical protein ABGT22_10170 [Peribacillus frigoritolerans]|uniref:hypothetical protein n=1 Tax=Peribacillus frigoritolerans TaxID=450367 RepID=UPI00345D22FC
MTKRKGILDVKVDVKKLLNELPTPRSNAPEIEDKQLILSSDTMFITNALDVITRQMKVSGNRSRTISDYYILHVKHFQSITKVQFVSEI